MGSMTNGAVARQVERLFERGSLSGLSESQLLEQFLLRRDEAAFEALVERLGPMVLAVCRRQLATRHDIEDAFQATFLVLVRKASTIRDRRVLAPWLYAVACKTAARLRARNRRRREQETPCLVPDEIAAEPTTSAPGVAKELRGILDDELGRLPEKYRTPLILCYLEGLTHDQAADRLSWPVGTVRGRLARGRDQLRQRLDRRGVSLAALLAAAGVAGEAGGAIVRSVPPVLVRSTTSAALALSEQAGSLLLGCPGIASTTLSLTSDVLRSSLMMKLSLAATGVTLAGLVATAAAVRGYQDAPAPAPAPRPATAAELPAPAPAAAPTPAALPPTSLPSATPVIAGAPASDLPASAAPAGAALPAPAIASAPAIALPAVDPLQNPPAIGSTPSAAPPGAAAFPTPVPAQDLNPPPAMANFPTLPDLAAPAQAAPLDTPEATAAYLEKTRREVAEAINRLATQEKVLSTRLQSVRTNLARLQQLHQVLGSQALPESGVHATAYTEPMLVPDLAPNGGAFFAPNSALLDTPTASVPGQPPTGNIASMPLPAPISDASLLPPQPSASVPAQTRLAEPVAPATQPALPGNVPLPGRPGAPNPASSEGTQQRIQALESKVDLLIKAIEQLQDRLAAPEPRVVH